jgi:hypothetical protein
MALFRLGEVNLVPPAAAPAAAPAASPAAVLAAALGDGG